MGDFLRESARRMRLERHPGEAASGCYKGAEDKKMGGRGSNGAGRGRAASDKWSVPEFSGSEKQVAWAKEIAEGAYRTLDFWQSYVGNPEQHENDGHKFDPYYNVDFTVSDVRELRKMLTDSLSTPQMRQAKNIIDGRNTFSEKQIRGALQGIHKDGMKWDSNAKKWIKAKR